MRIGINGFGRIGTDIVRYAALVAAKGELKEEIEFIVNVGRRVGKKNSVSGIIDYIKYDSTYGPLPVFLGGYADWEKEVIRQINGNSFAIGERVFVKVLTQTRKLLEIGWSQYGADLVIDATGNFFDPTGNLGDLLESGAKRVLVPAPFKKESDNSTVLIYGINHQTFDPKKHWIISGASCTTIAAAFALKPPIEEYGTRIKGIYAITIHAATGSQNVLDRLPSADSSDITKARATLANIVPASTGAAETLVKVLPEIKGLFDAGAVRVEIVTGSYLQLIISLSGEMPSLHDINAVYQRAAQGKYQGGLIVSKRNNVSSDIKGIPAGFIVEPDRTAIAGDMFMVSGWYDNEIGYVSQLWKLIEYIISVCNGK